MKKLSKLLPLCVLALTVSACAQCPKTTDYEKVPYSAERTTGTGVAVYDGKCKGKAMNHSATKGDAMMHDRMKK